MQKETFNISKKKLKKKKKKTNFFFQPSQDYYISHY